MHSLFGVIRTQNTPKFSNSGVTEIKSLFLDLKAYIFTSLVVLSMGVIIIVMLDSVDLITIDNGPKILFLLSLNSSILLFPIIYASVLTQWNMQMLQVRLYVVHFVLSVLLFVIGYEIFGVAMALVLMALVNSLFALKVYYALKSTNPGGCKL